MIEEAARTVRSVQEARVSVASQILTLRLASASADAREVEQAVAGIGYHLDPLTGDGQSSEGTPPSAHQTTAYRRALWIVVLLTVRYGIIG